MFTRAKEIDKWLKDSVIDKDYYENGQETENINDNDNSAEHRGTTYDLV